MSLRCHGYKEQSPNESESFNDVLELIGAVRRDSKSYRRGKFDSLEEVARIGV